MAKRQAKQLDVPPRPIFHVQSKISPEAGELLGRIADQQNITQSELVRDILYAFLFGLEPGSTMQSPNQGYRLAKASANVIAKRMLIEAYNALPETWAEFQKIMERSR